jgi:hypothetical protein
VSIRGLRVGAMCFLVALGACEAKEQTEDDSQTNCSGGSAAECYENLGSGQPWVCLARTCFSERNLVSCEEDGCADGRTCTRVAELCDGCESDLVCLSVTACKNLSGRSEVAVGDCEPVGDAGDGRDAGAEQCFDAGEPAEGTPSGSWCQGS